VTSAIPNKIATMTIATAPCTPLCVWKPMTNAVMVTIVACRLSWMPSLTVCASRKPERATGSALDGSGRLEAAHVYKNARFSGRIQVKPAGISLRPVAASPKR
jgi:hypothetical protein